MAYYTLLFTSQNRKIFEAFKHYSKSGQQALYNVNFCNAVLQVRREKKGKENSMQTLFTKVGTLAPTVRSFKQALQSSHRKRSRCSSSYQRQYLSQNMENRPVTATTIPEGCYKGEICGITSVVPAVSGVERLSA